MPKFKENDYIIGLWVAEDIVHNNFLMMLWEREDILMVEYRFRYLRDTKLWNSKDEKHFYKAEAVPGTSREEVLKSLCSMFKLVQTKYPLGPGYLPVEGDVEKLIEVLSADSVKHIFNSLSIKRD